MNNKYTIPILVVIIGILVYLQFFKSSPEVVIDPNEGLKKQYDSTLVAMEGLKKTIEEKELEQDILEATIADDKKKLDNLKKKQNGKINNISNYTPDELFNLCASTTRKSCR